MRTTRTWKQLLAAVVLVAGCGGGGGGSPAGQTTTPEPKGTGQRVETTVPSTPPDPAAEATAASSASAAAPRDNAWDAAVQAFADSDKAGWTADRCETVAQKFIDAGKNQRAEAFFNAGVAMAKCNRTADAERHYKKALDLKPNHAPSLGALGEIALRAGKTAEARDLFKRAADPNNDVNTEVTAARTNLAWLLYQDLRRTSVAAQRAQLEAEAIGHLQRALAIDNDNVVAYTVMALLYMEGAERNRNRLDVAQLLLDEGKKRNDRYAPLWNAYGILKMKRNNVAKALEDFRRAVELDPNLAEARMNVGQITLSSRNYVEAEKQFTEVLKLQKNSYEAKLGLGVALRGQATVLRAQGKTAEFAQKIQDAESAYKEAMALDRNRGDAYYNLGLLYKDYRTNEEDQSKNIAQYKVARQYFQDYLARADKADEKRAEAQGHIQDCDKYVDILTKAMASK
jgi:tetratricopeptide (TPR) repeat protein